MTAKNPTKRSSTRRAQPRQQRPYGNQRQGQSSFLIVVVVLAVLGAALAALIVTSLDSGGEDSEEPTAEATIAPASVTGDVPALPSFREDRGAGEPAPTIVGQTFDGEQLTAPRPGQPAVVMFLAHWCPHCQAEVPRVQAWLDAEGLPDDVDLVAVSTSIDPSRPNYPPEAWLDREGWSVPTLTDSSTKVAEAYGLTNFPFWVVIDAEGVVVTREAGELTESQLEALVTAAREGEVSPR